MPLLNGRKVVCVLWEEKVEVGSSDTLKFARVQRKKKEIRDCIARASSVEEQKKKVDWR